MPDLLTAPRADLIRLIYDLIDENKTLKAQLSEVKALMRKQGPSDGGKQPPSFIKRNVKKRKRRKKRKKREENFARKKKEATKKVFHAYKACPSCQGKLGEPSVAYIRQIEDIPRQEVEVAEHVVFKRWCSQCKKRIYPKLRLSGASVGKQRFGINLTSLVAVLNEEYLMPINKIQSFLKANYKLELSEGGIVRLLRVSSTKGEPRYKQIWDKLRESKVVYADETGSREDGMNGYQWSFSNEKYQLLWYHKRRNKRVVREFVGEEGDSRSFEGVMVSDFLASYNEYNGFQQRCWVHVLNDIKELKKEYSGRHPPFSKWAKQVKSLYKQAKNWTGPDPRLPLGVQAQERMKKESYYKEKLKEICEPYLTKDSPMSNLCARLIKHLPELFTFIRFEGVESHNNRAERALRHSVVKRKISGGTRSKRGSRTREILTTLFGTWRLQGLNPLEQMRLMLARAPCQEL